MCVGFERGCGTAKEWLRIFLAAAHRSSEEDRLDYMKLMTTSFSVKVALFTSFAVLLANSGNATNFPLATAGLHASDLDLNGGSLIDARSVLGVRNAAAFSTIQAAIDGSS